MNRLFATLLVLGILASPAYAQLEWYVPSDEQESLDEIEISADTFDPATCTKLPAARTATTTVPVTWSGFEIRGQLSDSEPVVRGLFEPTMKRFRALTEDAREEVRRISSVYGYHLISLGTRETADGIVAVVQLGPLPRVRRIQVDVKQSFLNALLDDEVRRRMRVRVGGYMAWGLTQRQCDLYEELERIQQFLRDEGYFEARTTIRHRIRGDGVSVAVRIELGDEYTTGIVNIAPREPNGITDDQIRVLFRHQACLPLKLYCFLEARFTRTQHQSDVKDVIELFHRRGFPSARVQTTLDHDRRRNRVNITVAIDQRRQLDVVFEGHNPNAISTDSLRDQLTFNTAASSDDVEAHQSAKALTEYLQRRGYFDARVTWSRERFERFDRLIYRIEEGASRRLQQIDYVGNAALSNEQLDEIIDKSARVNRSFFTTTTAATSEQFDIDIALILDAYRREGYRDAQITASAASVPAALGDPALTAALLTAGRGGGLYIRYIIDEGRPTMISRISVELGGDGDKIATPEQREACELALRELADLYSEIRIATPIISDRCIAAAPHLRFREHEVVENRDRLRDRLFGHGRPRSHVTYESRPLGPRELDVHYVIRDYQPLTIGKVVVRGNFRTRRGIILRELEELEFKDGAPLTNDALAEAARGLRRTGLFNSVNIAMPDLDNTSAGSVNALLDVTERYDFSGQVATETGYSSYNGWFIRLAPSFRNLFGIGLSLELTGTIGVSATEAVSGEAKLKQLQGAATFVIPQWLSSWFSPVDFQTEITAEHRRQDTPRFGQLTTNAVTLALSRTWQRDRTPSRDARSLTVSPHYDFRQRERLVDVLRPLGADDDQMQVPISTRTGSVGVSFEWEQRVNRQGSLSPLNPDQGFRWEAQASWANKYFLGQDHFVKLGAAGSYYHPIGDYVIVRADGRYDHGIPIGRGAVLLPEVERFFAGGDSTVRGYDDDRLATEIVEVPVPPLDNATQLRVLPAGGNVRALASLDAQIRVWNVLASGLFFDAGLVTNNWETVDADSIRPAVGVGLIRVVTDFGTLAFERAIPLRPKFGDDPRGRWHFSFAARAQF